MDTKDYTFLNKFRIDILDFNIYKNDSGEFMTTCRYNEKDSINDIIVEPLLYKDFEQLYDIFSDDITVDQLKEILSGDNGFDKPWSCEVN